MRSVKKSWNGRISGAADGKGNVGCLFSILLMGMAALVVVRGGPDYYAYKSLEGEVKTEVSRAGAHFESNEVIQRNILDVARKNEVQLKAENLKIERFAGQVFVTIRYSVPMDFIFYQYTKEFEIKASSYVGTL